MKNRSYQISGSRFLMTCTVLVLVAGTLAAIAFNPFKARKKARMVEAMNGGRQVSVALHMFAADNDGVYPSGETAAFFELPKDAKWSNDLFRQLIAGGYVASEKIFWVKGAQVCNAQAPDDVTRKDGKFDAAETLQAGDCGWAYMLHQTHASHPQRPILIDAWEPGTTNFDRKIWGGKVVVVRVDGSVLAAAPDAQGAVVIEGGDVLDAGSAVWKDSKQDPAKLLKQPEPAKKEEKGEKDPPAGSGEGS